MQPLPRDLLAVSCRGLPEDFEPTNCGRSDFAGDTAAAGFGTRAITRATSGHVDAHPHVTGVNEDGSCGRERPLHYLARKHRSGRRFSTSRPEIFSKYAEGIPAMCCAEPMGTCHARRWRLPLPIVIGRVSLPALGSERHDDLRKERISRDFVLAEPYRSEVVTAFAQRPEHTLGRLAVGLLA
jgi:hypothetical protein